MKTKKILVEVVAATMIVAPLAQPARVFNVHALDTTPVVQTTTESPELQNATVLIPSDATVEQVTEILNKALIKNLDNVDTSKIEWEYQCEGKSKSGISKNTAWGSIKGFESSTTTWGITTKYTHPSLASNSDGKYQVRIKGNDTVVTVTKAAKHTSAIEVNEGVEVTLPYDEDANVNYDALKENIFNSVVKSSNPELTVNEVNIQYYATGKIIFDGIPKKDWTSLEGYKDTFVEYPAISEGTQKIKISYNGNDTYYGAEKEVNITVKDRTPSDITVNEGQTIKLAYNDDLTVDYAQVEKDIFDKVIATSTPKLTVDDVTIQYHAKGLIGLTNKWVSIKGEKVNGVNYPAISEGEQEIGIIYKGSKDYQPHTVQTNINVVDRATVEVVKNEGPYNVSMKFNKDQSYDYDATAKAIYEAVIKSTNPELSFEDFKVEYNADPTSVLDVWYELSNSAALNLNKFKAGTWEIRLSWNATKEYKGGNIVVTVNVEDNRLESAVTLKEGTSITYNMDAQEMKKALFNSIDFSKSTLPSKDELSVDDFTYEYYGTNVITGNIDGGIKQWLLLKVVKLLY